MPTAVHARLSGYIGYIGSRQRTLTHLPPPGHLGALLVACFCGCSRQSAGISN
jgi:hypothetical protein